MGVGPPTLTHLIAAETRTNAVPVPPQQDGTPQAQARTRQWFEAEPLWFKRAVFYEVHVRGFFDANGDGIGDFRGLTEKLDYLQWLGIDCIWLLPFYQSPLRDGGYDISDFTVVNVDPHQGQEGVAVVPASLGLPPTFTVHDLVSDERFQWRIGPNYVRLQPGIRQAHILRVEH